MDRRRFVGLVGPGLGLALIGRSGDALARAPETPAPEPVRPSATVARPFGNPLPLPPVRSAQELTLTARAATVEYGPGSAEAWTLNGSVPAPTLRLRTGDLARITLDNRLPEPTILHWHGLDVPESADGHPRLAIDPGERYDYRFEVRDRAGTYWYHPHTHERTAPQTYRGMAGLLIVSDDEEEALRLPSDEYELPIVLQDKRVGPAGPLAYQPSMGPDMMLGYLGDTGFANGMADAVVEVKRGVYRLRLLNGANARICELGLTDGTPMTLIGADGGLLAAPATVRRVTMGTGERVDVLVDFSEHAPGDRIRLRSHPFQIPGMMMGGGMGGPGMGRGMRGRGGMGGGGLPQGAEMDLLELVVTGERGPEARPLPERLSELPDAGADARAPRRTFRFESMMMQHRINGRAFGMERVDERVPLGRAEVWVFDNQSGLPHPVHVHAGQFRVISRVGGRGRVLPWEAGLKDTVLVLPNERVEVGVRFTNHTGMYLLHCHNLEHEDMGMMSNFLVEE